MPDYDSASCPQAMRRPRLLVRFSGFTQMTDSAFSRTDVNQLTRVRYPRAVREAPLSCSACQEIT
ncbi:hypothetical protein AQJ27_50550 [Streptomyces olivochromogenes]|nr:hypothetical protein AQJ27_50550 [Streptomyces olivochromogenes]